MSKILVIASHPDDEVLGCGGTISKHIKTGDTVTVCFLADGISSRETVKETEQQRNQASKNALKILGCLPPIFLNYPDNQLDTIPLLEIVKKIEKLIEQTQANIIYTQHYGDLNIDHKITHKAVMTACRPQPGCSVKEIYCFETLSATHWQSNSMGFAFTPNCFVDISNHFENKMKALRCYDAEMRDFPHARSYQAVESLAKLRGSFVGIEYAEAFVIERITC